MYSSEPAKDSAETGRVCVTVVLAVTLVGLD